MNNQEQVSIITPLYNAERLLSQTIESVLAQTYTNWEMIIVDDHSTDRSLEVASGYAEDDRRIKLIPRSGNSGPAICRNDAIRCAQGRYIAFLDSDDLWSPVKLSRQLDFMREKNAAFSCTSYRKIDRHGRISQGTIHPPSSINHEQLLRSNDIGCLTAIYDTKMIGKQYQINMGHEDYILWLEILKKGYLAYGLKEALAFYRTGKASISSNKLKTMGFQWNIYRKIEKLSFTKSIYYSLWYAFKGLKKVSVK